MSGVHIVARHGADFDPVGVETPNHRGVHGVGGAERAVKIRPAGAEPRAAFAPDRIDARGVGRGRRVERPHLDRPPDVHRQIAPQRLKSGMHLGRDRACMGAGLRLARPQPRGRELLGEVFEDRQRFPDMRIAVDQHRHLAGAARRLKPRFEIGRIERDQRFLERNPRALHRQPRPERPRGIVLVADNQSQRHGEPARRSRGRNS